MNDKRVSISDQNVINITGRLTEDAKLGKKDDTSFLTFSLASNEYYTDRSGEERKITCFVDVAYWGNKAEELADSLTQGKPVFVSGKLTITPVESDGVKRKITRIKARVIAPL